MELSQLKKADQDYIREGIRLAFHYLDNGMTDNVYDILNELSESFCDGIDPDNLKVFYDSHRLEGND